MKVRPWRSLAAKLVLVGLIQLVLLALFAGAILVMQGPRRPPAPFEVITPDVQARLASVMDDADALRSEVAALKAKQVELSIYDADLSLISSSVTPPLELPPHVRPPHPGPPGGPPHAGPPPLASRPHGPPPKGPPPAMRQFVWAGGEGYLVAVGVPPPSEPIAPVAVLLVGFAILVIGALLTARWIVGPINQLSQMARAISAGNWSRRSDLAREDEIGELAAHLDQMIERIEHLVASERALLANVAHELRTPLARIGVAIDLANEGDAETARASLAEIAADAAELVALIDDVFLAARFEQAKGNIPLQRVMTPPAEIAEAAVARMAARHRERRVIATIAPDLPAILVDPVLFRRVLDNLLENAHKYSPELAAPISLTVTRDADKVLFQIADQGVGISPHDLPHVFDPFFRGDESRARDTGGVGLGLTLAKRIVDAHGGTIAVASAIGGGTTFSVAVPAAASPSSL